MQLRHYCIIVKNIFCAIMLLSNFRNYVVLFTQIMSLKLTFNGWVLILTVVCVRNQKLCLKEKIRASKI